MTVLIRADLLIAVLHLYMLHVQLHKYLVCTGRHQSGAHTAHLLCKKSYNVTAANFETKGHQNVSSPKLNYWHCSLNICI